MKHVVFVTYEFHPVNPGGAGVLIGYLAILLAKSGVRVTVMCAMPKGEVDQINVYLRSLGLNEGSIKAVCRNDFAIPPEIPNGELMNEFEFNSHLFFLALSRLHKQEVIDLIEFPEYGGNACATLRARAPRL